ncbi:MAG: hypothetical protein ICV59_06150 [Thermoleophilia bacterium]|nr:hypothetical protein [Thermoleophilia bacterium]
MDVRSFLLTLALAACSLTALPACGGGGGDDGDGEAGDAEAVTYTVKDAAACLRRAGVTQLNTNAGKVLAEGLAERGALEGRYGKTNFAVVFEENSGTAHTTEANYAAVAGGSWQPGVPLGALLKRAENAVLVYEDKPTARAKKAIESCFGGKPRIDADIEREYTR